MGGAVRRGVAAGDLYWTRVMDDWYWLSNLTVCLSGSEGDDAADRIVRGDADGDAIAWDDLDPKSPHPSAQLREHFMTCIALNPVEPPGMHGDDCPLHINEIVFTQQLILSPS